MVNHLLTSMLPIQTQPGHPSVHRCSATGKSCKVDVINNNSSAFKPIVILKETSHDPSGHSRTQRKKCGIRYQFVFLGLFMVNIFMSIVVTVYIVVYPAEWIVELMEVRCVFLPFKRPSFNART